jgi:hypothetical protein
LNRRGLPLAIAALGLAGLLVASCVPTAPAPPAPDGLHPRPAPATVAQWGRFEAALDVDDEPSNPYDPDVIDVAAVFESPSGAPHVALGFWFQDYERALVSGAERLTAAGTPHFRARFTPDQPGEWSWWWRVTTPSGTETTAPQALTVTASADPGFLRRSPRDDRFLAFDDGSPYFAVGENLGWYDGRGTYAYDSWVTQLSAQGANFARLWMPSWAFGIEWDDTGLGDYTNRLDRAWQLDYVFDLAAAHDLRIELSLLNHGAFSTAFNSEWDRNPYNAANGGPLATPEEFFTDATARDFFRQRLRYVVARWGYSTSLLAWEFWNEVDLTDGYDSANVAAWHVEMARELRALDPHDHLVSTSHSFFDSDPALWSLPEIDFTQLHFYSRHSFTWFPNLAQNTVHFTRRRQTQVDKPVLFAEFGINANGPVETRTDDPDGIAVHDGLWGGAVSGGIGTAMSWWWDNVIDVEPERYYPMFGAVARFVDGIAWDRQAFQSLTTTATTASGRSLVVYGLQGATTSLVWVKDDGYQVETPTRVEVADAVLQLGPLGARRSCGTWHDTWAGTTLGTVVVRAGTTTLPVPRFAGDVALRLDACPKK